MQVFRELATIFNAPLHPILVNFTAALIPASFLSDLLARSFRREALATAGWWMLLYAAIITPLTAGAGWVWYHKMEDMDHWQMNYHFWLGFTLAGLFIFWAVWRSRYYRRRQIPGWGYIFTTLLLVAALVTQGILGGEMTFGHEEAQVDQTESAGHHHQGAAEGDHHDHTQGITTSTSATATSTAPATAK